MLWLINLKTKLKAFYSIVLFSSLYDEIFETFTVGSQRGWRAYITRSNCHLYLANPLSMLIGAYNTSDWFSTGQTIYIYIVYCFSYADAIWACALPVLIFSINATGTCAWMSSHAAINQSNWPMIKLHLNYSCFLWALFQPQKNHVMSCSRLNVCFEESKARTYTT